jgi:Protein of unknown function (DUF559)
MALDSAAAERRIEQILIPMAAASDVAAESSLLLVFGRYFTQDGTSTKFGLGDETPAEDEIGRIFFQHPVGCYRVDILVDCHFGQRIDPLHLVVEHDGPWHDRPAQYHHDRGRDRYMTSLGYMVFRFTCNEARGFKGAMNCAREVGEGDQSPHGTRTLRGPPPDEGIPFANWRHHDNSRGRLTLFYIFGDRLEKS